MTLNNHVFAINVSGRNLNAEDAQRLLDKLINVGLADATSTLEDQDCSDPDTQLALDSNFSSPTLSSNSPADQLAQLKAAGLTFADCTRAFAEPNDSPFVVKAREQLLGDDELEIDDDTVIAPSDEGAFVMCWTHVSREAAGILPNSEVLELVWDKSTDWLAANARTLPLQEQSLLDSQTDWLEDLIGNFADELDGIASVVPKGAPGPIVWVGMDNESYTFLPSDALKRLIDLARQGGLDPQQVKAAEDFNSKFGQKLDAILTVVQTA